MNNRPNDKIVPRRRGVIALVGMLASAVLTVALLVVASPASAQSNPTGIDVSHWQGSINWTSVKNAGVDFAYIKATEGTAYKDPQFNTNYPAAYHAGVIRGAYHFARPGSSSGAAQAEFFASNGGDRKSVV